MLRKKGFLLVSVFVCLFLPRESKTETEISQSPLASLPINSKEKNANVADSMVVRGSRTSNISKLDQKSIENTTGIIENLQTLILQKPGVNSIPEAGSLLLVNGEGPFDNLFFIRGIPIFPPSDFVGHSFADKSVVTLALPNAVNCYTSNLVSQYSGAAGSVITINPLILNTLNRVPRPEAAFGLSTSSSDISLNVPLRNNKDRYQASFSVPDNYFLTQSNALLGQSNDLGYGIPASAWNLRTIGEQNLKSVKIEQLVWLGTNDYVNSSEYLKLLQQGSKINFPIEKYPWEIFAISAHDSLAKVPWNISLGGSRQFFLTSKSLGIITPITKVERRNLALNMQAVLFSDAKSSLITGILFEHLYADGSVELKDSIASKPLYNRLSNDNNGQFHIGYKRQIGHILFEVNSILGSYYGGKSKFIDPGFSLKFPALSGTMVFSSEINSAPADIRLLPNEYFDSFLSHTYHSHFTQLWNLFHCVKINADGFVEWKDRLPLMYDDPLKPYLDGNRKASMRVAGANLQIEAITGKWFSLTTTTSLCRSTIFEGNERYFPDWDCPLSNKTSMAFSIIPGKLTAYCIENYSAGFPYRDLYGADSVLGWSNEQYRIEDYKNVDVKFEWHQKTDGDLVTEYDTFISIQNILNNTNIREYQWGKNGKYPITLQPFTLNLGVRVNFRFLYW